MSNLTRAHNELFRRSPDERFSSLNELWQHCQNEKEESRDRWHHPQSFEPTVHDASVRLGLGSDGAFALNHWSFAQLCGLCGISRDTINRLSPATARQAFRETLPSGTKPLQVLTGDDTIRSIHGVAYSRLWNADLLAMMSEYATDFEPPQKGLGGATGLYCGQQDMFCFLIDPAGWTEIGDQPFAPGFFVWNSEVGKRSVGVQTFWFQAVCQNHIVWDAVEVIEFSRKHTGNVTESLSEIRRIVESLVAKRDERKDCFAEAIQKAMKNRVATDADEATKFLTQHGITRSLVKKAVARISESGNPFTIWTLVDALTQLTGETKYAGERTEADQKVAKLLALST